MSGSCSWPSATYPLPTFPHPTPAFVMCSWNCHSFFPMKLEPGPWGSVAWSDHHPPALYPQEAPAQGSSALLQGCAGPPGPWEGGVQPSQPEHL